MKIIKAIGLVLAVIAGAYGLIYFALWLDDIFGKEWIVYLWAVILFSMACAGVYYEMEKN